MKITCKRSSRGVPHILAEIDGKTFSVCYFGTGGFYRIFLSTPGKNKKLEDVVLSNGGSFDLEFVLRAIIIKYSL